MKALEAYDSATQHLAEIDPAFGRLIERVGPCGLGKELKPITTTFEALLEAITHQQLSVKAAATIYRRVSALAPSLEPDQYLELEHSALRDAGLSRAKVLAVRDLAERSCMKEIPDMRALQGMDDESIIESLIKVRGIGRWSAEMLLIFRLGRPDVFPVNDLGIQKGFATSFRRSKLPILTALENRGKRWRPYRSIASWYLWRAAEMSR